MVQCLEVTSSWPPPTFRNGTRPLDRGSGVELLSVPLTSLPLTVFGSGVIIFPTKETLPIRLALSNFVLLKQEPLTPASAPLLRVPTESLGYQLPAAF